MFNYIFIEWRGIFSSTGSVLPGSHKGCPLNISVLVFLYPWELGSWDQLYTICFFQKLLDRRVHSRSCPEQGAAVPVPSLTASLCFVPPQSQSASPKQRKQSVFTPPALKGTAGSCPAPGGLGGSGGGGTAAPGPGLCPPAAELPQGHAQPSLPSHCAWQRPPDADHLFILSTEPCWSSKLICLREQKKFVCFD